MSPAAESRAPGIRRFRIKLFIAMMVVVSTLTSSGIYFAQERAAEDAQADLQRDFELELSSLHRLQDLRNAAVADRSRKLAQNARIHAALEDNALDLLYPSAREELRDLMGPAVPGEVDSAETLHARFYRFLDSHGEVIPPPSNDAGVLLPNEEARLARPGLFPTLQIGYLARRDEAGRSTVDEMIAVPIRSTETNGVIAALVLGFKPVETVPHGESIGMKSGILVDGQLQLTELDQAAEEQVAREVTQDLAHPSQHESLRTTIGGVPHLLFYKKLNLDSDYPPAYEVCVYPLDQLLARQARLRWQILSAGGLLLVGGFLVSHFVSRRLSRPVEALAVVSEENFTQRQRAEAELQTTSEELQRSARFSADASHQLKSPITVLRAGLDSLLAREGLPEEVYEEVSTLIHQTYRLTGVVEDLLLLSRMDAGKLRLTLKTVDLTLLVGEWLDDLQAMPEAADLRVAADIPEGLQIAGEIKYTSLVVQNLLDNARKYNRPGGSICLSASRSGREVELRVKNSGRGIPATEQPYIFERFHRAGASADVPGHGLGLNLARELVRLHGGELRLVISDSEWTEFSAVFRAAVLAPQPSAIAS
ncbi:MAG: HAMP domain-containing histidine kinase [Chthoniobacterales bacterium]|nr:HAMP domain-containing histidine kinase [Chthoniobacterales bacterium]